MFGFPKNKRTFTTEEIAEGLNTTSDYIRRLTAQLKIQHEVEYENGCLSIYPMESYLKIKAYIDASKKRKVKKEDEKKLTVEELQKEHPLVKNPIWFNLSAFPEVIPSGYEDIQSILFGGGKC